MYLITSKCTKCAVKMFINCLMWACNGYHAVIRLSYVNMFAMGIAV